MSYLTTEQLRAIAAYCAATKNEIKIDSFTIDKLGLNHYFSFSVPRAVVFGNRLKKKPAFWKLALKFLAFLWWFPIFPILLLVKICFFLYQKKQKETVEVIKRQEIILGTTHRIYDLIKRLSPEERPQIWLQVPWLKLNYSPPPTEEAIQLFSLVQWSDIIWTLKMSWIGARGFSKKVKHKEDCLQSYTAPEWFLLWRVLEKLDSKISAYWIANNSDRWAILVDRVQRDKKTVVIQHAIFFKEISWPSRLRNVKEIYVFNQTFYEIYRRNYMANLRYPDQKKLPISINLSSVTLPIGKTHSVLIISQPLSAEQETEIMVYLLQNYPCINILFKPHPLYRSPLKPSLIQHGVNHINDKLFYPDVNLAITCSSSLGLEYESSGVPVIWFENLSTDQSIAKIDKILRDIIST